MSKGIMSRRVALTDSTWEALRDFTHGLGTTYDEAVKLLLDHIMESGELPYTAGYRLRKAQERPSNDAPSKGE